MPEPIDPSLAAKLRRLPQVDKLASALPGTQPRSTKVEAAREAIAAAKQQLIAGAQEPGLDTLVESAAHSLSDGRLRSLQPVLNATGVLLHTNLGRAPLSDDALEAIRQVGEGFSNLEFDLQTGSRGSRYNHAADTLTALTGAEAALVVNNNAAAVLLALAGLCAGREVIVSRGELIEIGGEFRIPEIMALSGAVMREVGTTNRTHMKDYENAINENTAAILKVHPSNYEVTGFTASVESPELAGLSASRGIRFINDIGSGLLSQRIGGQTIPWLGKEPTIEHAVADGADLVTFSGDKLLGGPQAGIIVGSKTAVDELRHVSWLRTFRCDKTVLAALDATLDAYLRQEPERLPLWRMALAPQAQIRDRATKVAETIAPVAGPVEVTDGFSTTGGGSAPSSRIPSALVRVPAADVPTATMIQRLLAHIPAIVARVEDNALLLDLRTVHPDYDATVTAALAEAITR